MTYFLENNLDTDLDVFDLTARTYKPKSFKMSVKSNLSFEVVSIKTEGSKMKIQLAEPIKVKPDKIETIKVDMAEPNKMEMAEPNIDTKDVFMGTKDVPMEETELKTKGNKTVPTKIIRTKSNTLERKVVHKSEMVSINEQGDITLLLLICKFLL